MKKKHIVVVAVLLVACVAAMLATRSSTPSVPSSDGNTQEFPFASGTTIRLIVPYSAGGGYDVEARLAAPYIQEYLNQNGGSNITIYVENVTGGAGLIATTQAYTAAPDGTNILFLDPESSLWQQMLQDNVPFDISKFVYLGQQSADPLAMILQKDVEATTFGELIALSKRTPLLLGTCGLGNYDHIFPSLFELLLADSGIDIDFEYLHFAGTGETMASLQRNEAKGSLEVIGGFMGSVQEGYAKFLFSFTNEPYVLIPDTPTLAQILEEDPSLNIDQSALDDLLFAAAFRRVYAAPPGTNEQITKVLSDAIGYALTNEAFLVAAKEAKRIITYVDAAGVREIIDGEYNLATRYRDRIAEAVSQ